MITSRRSTDFGSSFAEKSSGVDLLERKLPQSYDEYTSDEAEDMAVAKERMQRNLERLLHYDAYQNDTVTEVEENVSTANVVENNTTFSDDDIRPTSTTMQFGDGDADQILNDLNRGKGEEEQDYHLNKKGKIVVALYAVAVSIILALIVLNTGVLAVLSEKNMASTEMLNTKVETFNSLQQEIDNLSSNENVLNIAENEFGMISE